MTSGTLFIEIEGHKPAEEGLRPALRENTAADQDLRSDPRISADLRLADEEHRAVAALPAAPRIPRWHSSCVK